MKRICVFCGSNLGTGDRFLKVAQEMGRAIVERDLGLVFGGGRVGLMGVVADAVVDAGGDAIGIIPELLLSREFTHPRVADVRIVGSMEERKRMMSELSDAFVTLPGGTGTLDEFFEMCTNRQVGLHDKPMGLVNDQRYFDGLLVQIDAMVADRMVPSQFRGSIAVADTPREVLGHMGL